MTLRRVARALFVLHASLAVFALATRVSAQTPAPAPAPSAPSRGRAVVPVPLQGAPGNRLLDMIPHGFRQAVHRTFARARTSSQARNVRRVPRPAVAPGVALHLEPISGRPYLYWLDVSLTTWDSADVAADRRLLRLALQQPGQRRAVVCTSSSALRGAPRMVHLARGEHSSSREWIDVRDYCWGKQLTALDAGAAIVPSLALRTRPRRGDVVARGPSGETVTSLVGTELAVVAAAPRAEEAGTPRAVEVALGAVDTQVGARIGLGVRLTAQVPTLVYPRVDAFSFRVAGPLGTTTCGVSPQPVVPLRDFFRTIGPRGGVAYSVDAHVACPHAFELPGIYEVTPVVTLTQDGQRFALRAAVGEFVGHSAALRVRAGAGAYVEQTPDTLPRLEPIRRQGGASGEATPTSGAPATAAETRVGGAT